jgi:carbon storage regulator
MLVLSRRVDQRIMIDGGRIIITVVDIRNDKVRIGIDAPDDVVVNREEVQRAIERDGFDGTPRRRV